MFGGPCHIISRERLQILYQFYLWMESLYLDFHCISEILPLSSIHSIQKFYRKSIPMQNSYLDIRWWGWKQKPFLIISSHAIQNQLSCPHTLEQNGIAKKNQHIVSLSRALFYQSHLPHEFSPQTFQIAFYKINKLPSSILNYKTLHELLFHKK